MIYHITSRHAWEHSIDSYRHPSLEAEGFIHFSTINQVLRTAHRYFVGQGDLVLLEIDPGRLLAPLRYEEASASPGEIFPHLYGALNLDAVTQVIVFPSNVDGTFSLPPALQ